MSEALNQKDWDNFNEVMGSAVDSFFTKECVWIKTPKGISAFMEDTDVSPINRTIRCLCNYNYMRSWPITQMTETGQLDRQSIQMLWYKKDLQPTELSANGYPLISPEHDLIQIDGVLYQMRGDTAVSQIDQGGDLLFSIILVRNKHNTSDKV